MRQVYEAANSIEGHMILGLLTQAGLNGRVDGDYLQGGIGELQAAGFIRVMVESADYEKALVIIRDWESLQPEPEESEWAGPEPEELGTEPRAARFSSHSILYILLGLLLVAILAQGDYLNLG